MLKEYQNHTYNLPDFFIVGAPKCGTTALTEYLRQHPGIFLPKRKEINHFATDLFDPGERRLQEEFYYSFYKNASHDKVVGDASVFHLYSRVAAENIKKFNPDAKIIIMLRNPVDMLYSYHSQMVFNNDEDIEDFESALKAEQERKDGKRIPLQVNFVSKLYYSEIIKYDEQVKRYLDAFSNDEVLVIIFDEFRNDTADVYKKVLEFVGVDKDFIPEFKVVNPNAVIRSGLLRSFYSGSPAIRDRVGRILLPSQKLRRKILHFVKNLNTKPVQRKKLDPSTRKELLKKCELEVKRLESLINKDLKPWYN